MTTQITSRGRPLQDQSRRFETVDDLPLGAHTPLEAENADSRQVRGLYVHVPFCFHKCHYCDFYSIVDRQDRRGPFAERLAAELEAIGPRLSTPVETVFFGGGTPTLLSPEHWEVVLAALAHHLPLAPDAEITVEANPETVTPGLADRLVAGGVNRVSVGAQTFHRDHLATLERHHEPDNVGRSVETLRAAGIASLNLDLIFAVPGQTLAQWTADVDAALALGPEHVSAYALTYEPNTPLTAKLRSGRLERADEDLEAAMYETTMDRLAAAGFEHYEVSAWARSGHRCRHNLLYWSNGSWWPAGPGAAGHVDGWRWRNVPRLDAYLRDGPLPSIQDVEWLGRDGRIGETFMLGLRRIDGLAESEVETLLAEDAGERRAVIERACADGRLERRDGRLRFTRAGLMVADSVLAELI